MLLFLFSILALLVGPLIYSVLRSRDEMLSLLDGLIFVTITGLVLVFILPESFESGGWPTIAAAIAGLALPTLLEGFSRRLAKNTHLVALVLGLSGLGLHAIIDGTALSTSSSDLLPLAVILHRLPVGLAIWWLLSPAFGNRTAVSVIGGVGVATLIGFLFGPSLTSGLSSQGLAWFQALVAGSLLHVVFHQPHLKDASCGCREVSAGARWYEGSGALIGIALTTVLLTEGANHGDAPLVFHGFKVFWALLRESAPALMLAYIMAGAMSAFLPHSSIRWLRRGSVLTQSFRGMAVGLPFPVCSCGVIPLYRTLISRGAPIAAGMAFLISTPELGLDAVLISIPLLGGEMTMIRIVAAGAVAAIVGCLVGAYAARQAASGPEEPNLEVSLERGQSLGRKLLSSLAVGLGEVVDHTAPWILLGLGVAAMIHPFLASGTLSRIPDLLEVPLFTLIGLPAYVCASGATPLVAVLLSGGVSPGAALAFLLTGPATNVTTFGMLAKMHGRSVALVFSGTIILLSMALGYGINLAFPTAGEAALDPAATDEATTVQLLCVLALTATYLYSVLRRGPRKFVGELLFSGQQAVDLHPHYH